MDCIFCAIASNKLDTKFIYEDNNIIAFDDLHPKATIHKLIIPRKHIATLNDLEESDSELVGKLLCVTKNIARQLNIAKDGYRIIINCNKNGGQEVFHLHLHLLGGSLLGRMVSK